MILIGLMKFWPIAEVNDLLMDTDWGPSSNADNALPFPLAFIGYAIMALCIVCIWMYKDRKKQLIIGRVTYFLTLAYIVIISLSLDRLIEAMGGSPDITYGVSLFLPLIAMGFLFLANRAVKKDEELVRSLDRLR